jgi:hypothetical protein
LCTAQKSFWRILALSWLENARALEKVHRQGGVLIAPRASSLDDLEIAKPRRIVYASRAPSWSQLDPNVPTFPEMPEGMKRPGPKRRGPWFQAANA